jgi:5-methyltetrahydrofolate--homocysteine methyltransferase
MSAGATALRARLAAGPPLLLDGGLGTMLIARGLPAGAPPDAWTTARPEVLTEVHRAYVAAGSEAVHANTFGANGPRLARFGLADRAAELNAAAVALARAAGPRFVIADVGPSGDFLPPVGTADPATLRAAFAAQGRALAAAGVDGLHLETMIDLREARLALEALLETAPAIPILVSLTFEQRRRGFFTIMGNALGPALRELAAAGAAAVGANCSVTSAAMGALAGEALAAVDCPLVLQPNAGAPELVDGAVRYRQAPEVFADDMAAVAAAGVRAVGGCCGTDPRFIAALRARLDRPGRGAAPAPPAPGAA